MHTRQGIPLERCLRSHYLRGVMGLDLNAGLAHISPAYYGPAGTASYSVVMNRHGKAVLGLLLFNCISAVGGGIALMTGMIPTQKSWIQHTGFSSLYFPGVILMAIVGGSSLVAASAMMKRTVAWQLSSILAGVVMLFWIVGEIASIRGFHFLQVIYFITGALVIWLTPAGNSPADAVGRPSP